MSRLAFLFLTYGTVAQPRIWQTFLRGHERRYSLYCHPKPGSESTPFLAPYVIPKHTPTKYGHVSLVRAMLYLLEAAMARPENELFVFVSGQCIPTCRFPVFYDCLAKSGRSRMTRVRANMERYSTIDTSVIPYAAFYKASQWIVLNRKHAEICLAGPIHAYEKANVPDEHYFVTTLTMAGVDFASEVDERNLAYVKWGRFGGRTRPHTYSTIPPEVRRTVIAGGYLIFRKVDASPLLFPDWCQLVEMGERW